MEVAELFLNPVTWLVVMTAVSLFVSVASWGVKLTFRTGYLKDSFIELRLRVDKIGEDLTNVSQDINGLCQQVDGLQRLN